MKNNKTLNQKISEAKALIIKALKKHGNGVYVAFSGGKDSYVLLKMAREIRFNILVIYNEHKGENPKLVSGLLIIKEPKKINVPKFLKLVKLTAQLDGTRKDEDKLVMINGKDIHRSKMKTNYTKKGVWGLEVYFPLFNFTEKDIYEYFRRK